MKTLIAATVLLVSVNSVVAQLKWTKILDKSQGSLHGVVDEQTVFALRDTTILRSTDGGMTWQETGKMPTWEILNSTSQRVQEEPTVHAWKNDSTIVQYTRIEDSNPSCFCTHAATYTSTDAGASWSRERYGFTLPVQRVISTPKMFASYTPFGYLDGGIPMIGSLRVTRDTSRWGLSFNFYKGFADLTDEGLVFMTIEDTLYRHDLPTGERRKLATPLIRPRVTGQNSLIYSDEVRLYASQDAGNSWTQLDLPEGLTYSTNRECVIFAYDSLTAFRSIDCGQSWQKINGSHPYHRWYPWIVVNDSVIYAKTPGATYRTITSDLKLRVEEGMSEAKSLQVYPNPASQVVRSDRAITWFDLLGRSYSVPSEKIGDQYRYDVSGLNKGAYLVISEGRSQIVFVQR